MSSNRQVVFASANFTRTYATAYYVAEELTRRGVDVDLWAYSGKESRRDYPLLSHTPYDGPAGRLPFFRHSVFKQRIYRQALRKASAFICYELRYFDIAVRTKLARPDMPLVLFAPELMLRKDFPTVPWLAEYERGARLPDLTIDVNEPRAAKRKELFEITNEIVVIPNTLPRRLIDSVAGKQRLKDLVGRQIPSDMPIVIYTGGLHSDVFPEEIAEALGIVKKPFYFVAFCHGLPGHKDAFRRHLEEHLGCNRFAMLPSVNRNDLLAVLGEAHLGLVYYPCKENAPLGTVYAAPGKFYEYVAAGLGIVSSGNPTLVPLIEGKGIGCCCKEDNAKGLAEALGRALDLDFSTVKQTARRLFNERWCFEQVSPPVIDAILRCIRKTPD